MIFFVEDRKGWGFFLVRKFRGGGLGCRGLNKGFTDVRFDFWNL